MKKIDFRDILLSVGLAFVPLIGFAVFGFIVLSIIAGVFYKFFFEYLLLEKLTFFIYGYIILVVFIALWLSVKWFNNLVVKPLVVGVIIIGVPALGIFMVRELIVRNFYFVLIASIVGAFVIYYLFTIGINEFGDEKDNLKDNLPLIVAIFGFVILLWLKLLGVL